MIHSLWQCSQLARCSTSVCQINPLHCLQSFKFWALRVCGQSFYRLEIQHMLDDSCLQLVLQLQNHVEISSFQTQVSGFVLLRLLVQVKILLWFATRAVWLSRRLSFFLSSLTFQQTALEAKSTSPAERSTRPK